MKSETANEKEVSGERSNVKDARKSVEITILK
jgi:hypothetical protein